MSPFTHIHFCAGLACLIVGLAQLAAAAAPLSDETEETQTASEADWVRRGGGKQKVFEYYLFNFALAFIWRVWQTVGPKQFPWT